MVTGEKKSNFMSKNKVDLIVVIPIGPDNNGSDTIDSVFCYCIESVIIIAVDDSRSVNTKKYLDNVDPRVIRLSSSGYKGIRGALWLNLIDAYKFAIENYKFKVLLRIDTDGLVINSHPEKDALKFFNSHPGAGMLGAYKKRSDGKKRNFIIVACIILRETSIYGISYPDRRILIKELVKEARKKGYRLGEHCQGGAVFQSYSAIAAMYINNKLNSSKFQPMYNSAISEDHLFSLLTILLGFTLEDFATEGLPMGIKWRGLPDSPENLVLQNKKIIHSIKFWQDMDQEKIRIFFARKRINDNEQA